MEQAALIGDGYSCCNHRTSGMIATHFEQSAYFEIEQLQLRPIEVPSLG
jgi:hypothetical protein